MSEDETLKSHGSIELWKLVGAWVMASGLTSSDVVAESRLFAWDVVICTIRPRSVLVHVI